MEDKLGDHELFVACAGCGCISSGVNPCPLCAMVARSADAEQERCARIAAAHMCEEFDCCCQVDIAEEIRRPFHQRQNDLGTAGAMGPQCDVGGTVDSFGVPESSYRYRGKPLTEMSREELIVALEMMGRLYTESVGLPSAH